MIIKKVIIVSHIRISVQHSTIIYNLQCIINYSTVCFTSFCLEKNDGFL